MAILATGNTFADNDQVTATKLNNAVNAATFVAGTGGSTDNTTLEVSSGVLRIKDDGVTQAKCSFIDGNSVMTLTGTTPKLIFDDTDVAITAPQISADSADGNLSIAAGNSGAQITLFTQGVSRLEIGEDVSKDAANSASAGIRSKNDIYAEGDISADGDVVASLSSDIRLKENVTPIVDAIDKVNKLSGCTFKWKDCATYNGDDIGVIAQEVQKVIPSAVKERHDGYLKVDYTRLVPLLLESIKELSQKIEILESKSHTHGLKE
jgi:hypothetical protein